MVRDSRLKSLLGDVHRIRMTVHNIPDHLCPSNLLVEYPPTATGHSIILASATRPRGCMSAVRKGKGLPNSPAESSA